MSKLFEPLRAATRTVWLGNTPPDAPEIDHSRYVASLDVASRRLLIQIALRSLMSDQKRTGRQGIVTWINRVALSLSVENFGNHTGHKGLKAERYDK